MSTTGKVTLALTALALGAAAWWLFRPETDEERRGREPPRLDLSNPRNASVFRAVTDPGFGLTLLLANRDNATNQRDNANG